MSASVLLLVLWVASLILSNVEAPACVWLNNVHVVSMNDVTVEELKTWSHPLFSTGVCLAECWGDPHCVSVQVDEVGDSCLGYTVSLEVEGTFQQTPASGVKTYITDRANGNYGSGCSQTVQCNFANADCAPGGYCRCELGFAFTPGQNTCERECASLGSGLEIYFGPYDLGETLNIHSDFTLDECKGACLQHTDCVAFDFMISTKKCYLANTRYLDVVESNRRVDDDHYYGMRHCDK